MPKVYLGPIFFPGDILQTMWVFWCLVAALVMCVSFQGIRWRNCYLLTEVMGGGINSLQSYSVGVCEKVASNLGSCSVFHRVLKFPPPLATG